MRTTERLPLETYRVRVAAYCGMAYDLGTELTKGQARTKLAHFLARVRRTNGPGTIVPLHDSRDVDGAVLPSYELQTPETAVMVSDSDGYVSIERETAPAVECYECGSLVRVGECCECHESYDNDNDTEDR